MRKSNYDITRDQMRGEFVKYDQKKMISKFSLRFDDDYLYIPYLDHTSRIGRKDGVVEWSKDDFSTVFEADFNESMTIYDILCYSKDNCHLSGQFCSIHMLKETVKTTAPTGDFFASSAQHFRGRIEELKSACTHLGHPIQMAGDVSFQLYPFPFLPITLQFWDADEEFPANIKFMFDENILDYMHFETTFYMIGSVIAALQQ